ncbi:histidine kinase 1 [Nymphaea colorata]|nr:histidine kinase 1 [Nymphaea colorata]
MDLAARQAEEEERTSGYSSRNNGRRATVICGSSMPAGDLEDQDLQHGSARCLTSYYSVFVARLAIMVMLAILICMLTMLTWHVTRVYTTESINSLAYGLRFELLQRPVLRMWNILNSTVEIAMTQVQLSEYVIGRYTKPVTHTSQPELYEVMKDISWALFSSRNALNAITISYINGFVQAFHRDNRNNNTFYIYSDIAKPVSGSGQGTLSSPYNDKNMSYNGNVSATWFRVPLDPLTGESIGNGRKILPEDLIKIAGISELRDGAASWHVAVSKFTDSPLLSAALPVRHPSDQSIMAVVGVTTAFHSVGQLMRELVEIHSGYMYLTSQEGFLLATSTDAPLLRNTEDGPELMLATDSEDQMIRSGAQWLEKTYGDKLLLHNEVHIENVQLSHQEYYIDTFFLNLKKLPLVGVIIIPRRYIMGKVDQRAIATLVILISASICILAVGCLCILILTSGVSKEMKLRAELISHLEARRRAEASNNYKSQFLANMSHELRTPMAAVIGLLDILICDDCLTNEQFSTVSQIRKCSTALLRLLNNILDLSKVEAGKLILEEAEFDLRHELEGLVDMFSVQCIDQNVELVLDISDDMPKLVRGDSARVVQIFANLISNSIKFTSSGYIICRGWCESSPHGNTRNSVLDQETSSRKKTRKDAKVTIWFEVEDTGCGIDPSKWESVFESFEQADPSTTRKYGGTGLGLCIVRTLVRKMGGEIKVVKKKGPGTLMQLYLVFSTPAESMDRSCSVELKQRNLMVLLALKGCTSRSVMAEWLKNQGIRTREVSDWNKLLQILNRLFLDKAIILRDKHCHMEIEEQADHDFLDLRECSQCRNFAMSGDQRISWNQNLEKRSSLDLVIIVDAGLLDLSSDQWKGQLDFLDKYGCNAEFAWVINHNTRNVIKTELRRKGYSLMVNRPLYKSKLIQVLEAAGGIHTTKFKRMSDDSHDCVEMASFSDVAQSDDSDMPEEETRAACPDQGNSEVQPPNSYQSFNKCLSVASLTYSKQLDDPEKMMKHVIEAQIAPPICIKSRNYGPTDNENKGKSDDLLQPEKHQCSPAYEKQGLFALPSDELHQCNRISDSCYSNHMNEKPLNHDKGSASFASNSGNSTKQQREELLKLDYGSMTPKQRQKEQYDHEKRSLSPPLMDVPNQKPLEGLHILLAEDTVVLRRVATTMLEKFGATVVSVGDGVQAVHVLENILITEKYKACSPPRNTGKAVEQMQEQEISSFDLILMDCQMPKMDGYEATRAIRGAEAGTGRHIPIVALTAHAMSSDEAKCLDVGMDAYLTKPIDSKLMVSTILSLTKATAKGKQ